MNNYLQFKRDSAQDTFTAVRASFEHLNVQDFKSVP